MKSKTKLLVVLMSMITHTSYAQNDNKRPQFSDYEKAKSVQRLHKLAQDSNAQIINSSSNYNKAMFDAARQGYGGYSEINVEFDENDKELSSAEKRSIQNTRRNAEIIKEQLKGLK